MHIDSVLFIRKMQNGSLFFCIIPCRVREASEHGFREIVYGQNYFLWFLLEFNRNGVWVILSKHVETQFRGLLRCTVLRYRSHTTVKGNAYTPSFNGYGSSVRQIRQDAVKYCVLSFRISSCLSYEGISHQITCNFWSSTLFLSLIMHTGLESPME